MEEDPELENLFNEWKIEEEENIRYRAQKNDNFAKKIENTRKYNKIYFICEIYPLFDDSVICLHIKILTL